MLVTVRQRGSPKILMQDTDYSAINALRTQATMVDYPGRMAALVFTAGCNFRCGFCHNPDLLSGNCRTYTFGELGERCQRYKKQWVEAVSISGGEPTLRPELPDTVRFFKQQGFCVKLDTNGSRPEVLEALLPSLDYVAMDIKCAPSRYEELTGYGDLDKLRRSIKLIMDSGKDYEFRTTWLEDFHNDNDVLEAGEMIRGARRWLFQPFIPHENLPDEKMRTMSRTRPSVLEHAAELARAFVQTASAR